MVQEIGVVVENKKLGAGHYRLKIRSGRIGRAAQPGQFVQIQCSRSTDPLLPRPFSFLDTDASGFTVLYRVVGCGTEFLKTVQPGQTLAVTGPLGRGFGHTQKIDSKTQILLAGGGVGIPPLVHWARHLMARKKISKKNIHVFLGARNKSFLLCEKEFKDLGVAWRVATDDGSQGTKGFVTGILQEFLNGNKASTALFACGPTPMLKAISAVAKTYQIPCEVSVEVPMACGFGACLGCAITVHEGAKTRFATACVEGPVFKSQDIAW